MFVLIIPLLLLPAGWFGEACDKIVLQLGAVNCQSRCFAIASTDQNEQQHHQLLLSGSYNIDFDSVKVGWCCSAVLRRWSWLLVG